jgi:hypothetical protein
MHDASIGARMDLDRCGLAGDRRTPAGTLSVAMRTGMRWARRTHVKAGLTLASCASPPLRSRSSTPPAMLSTWPWISSRTPISQMLAGSPVWMIGSLVSSK